MDFEWTEKERATKKAVADVAKTLEPQAEEIEGASPGRRGELLRLTLEKLEPSGYLSLAQGEKGAAEALEVMAGQLELAQLSGSLYLAVESSCRLFGSIAAALGSQKAQEEILGPLSKGKIVGAVALSEPSPAPHGHWATKASDGDRPGTFVLSGQKSFVTNGPVADWVAVAAGWEGQSLFLIVPTDQPGLTVGDSLKTMGFDGLTVAPITFEGARAEHVVGPFEDTSFLDTFRQVEALVLTAGSVGLMQRCLEAAKSHAVTHKRGAGPVGGKQKVGFKLAEMLTLARTSRLQAYRAGWMYGSADPEAKAIIQCAQVFAAEAAEKVASMAMDILAGQGFLFGNVVERSYREAKFAGLAGNTKDLTRMAIADQLLAKHG